MKVRWSLSSGGRYLIVSAGRQAGAGIVVDMLARDGQRLPPNFRGRHGWVSVEHLEAIADEQYRGLAQGCKWTGHELTDHREWDGIDTIHHISAAHELDDQAWSGAEMDWGGE